MRKRTDFSAGVLAREFLDGGAAIEDMPVILLKPGNPVPVMVFRDPCLSLIHI